MLGDRVVYKLTPDMERLAFVTRDYDDGTVDITVQRNATDLTYPLDYQGKGFAKVKYGNDIGQCRKISDPLLKELVADVYKELQAERMAKARAARGQGQQSNDDE